jgi:phosphoribosylformylglycinamidine (FGAM) synthase-like amidotransferase family enzyme
MSERVEQDRPILGICFGRRILSQAELLAEADHVPIALRHTKAWGAVPSCRWMSRD